MMRQHEYQPSIFDQLYSELSAERKQDFLQALENESKSKRESILTNLFLTDPNNIASFLEDLVTTEKFSLFEEATLIRDKQNQVAVIHDDIRDKKKDTSSNVAFVDPNEWESKLKQEDVKPRTIEEILAEIRELFDDIITTETIQNAVITPQGTTYEEEEIQKWINKNKIDPKDSSPLSKDDLRPHHLLTELNAYYKKENVNILIFPGCLYCEETGKLFEQPVVMLDGTTKEFATLKPIVQETFYENRLNASNQTVVVQLYSNLLVERIITLVNEARANYKLESVSYQKKKAHPHKLFTHSNINKAKTDSNHLKYDLDRKEIDLLHRLSSQMAMLTKTPTAIYLAEFEACSLLCEVMRNKVDPNNIFSDRKILTLLTQGKLQNISIEILEYIKKRDLIPLERITLN